jgi:hypothetical protein
MALCCVVLLVLGGMVVCGGPTGGVGLVPYINLSQTEVTFWVGLSSGVVRPLYRSLPMGPCRLYIEASL